MKCRKCLWEIADGEYFVIEIESGGENHTCYFCISERFCDPYGFHKKQLKKMNIRIGDKPDKRVQWIHTAIRRNEKTKVDEMLEEDFGLLFARDLWSRTHMHVAARYSSREMIEYFLEKGAGFKSYDYKGGLPLHWASFQGNEHVVELLAGPDTINFQDKSGQTALHLAATEGRENVVKLLLNLGAADNIEDKRGFTALRLAKVLGRMESQFILEGRA